MIVLWKENICSQETNVINKFYHVFFLLKLWNSGKTKKKKKIEKAVKPLKRVCYKNTFTIAIIYIYIFNFDKLYI